MDDFPEDRIKPDWVGNIALVDDVSATLELICKDVADKLEKHYPGWLWALMPNERPNKLPNKSPNKSGVYSAS
jgi:hypothetical protein